MADRMADQIWWERRRHAEPTNQYLARVLEGAGLHDMATRALAYHFDDYFAPDDIDDGKTRQLRPLGSSLFLRWPEFGYGLRPTPETMHEEHPSVIELSAWRGARDERYWPKQLKHGHTLPWEPVDLAYYDRPPLREVS